MVGRQTNKQKTSLPDYLNLVRSNNYRHMCVSPCVLGYNHRFQNQEDSTLGKNQLSYFRLTFVLYFTNIFHHFITNYTCITILHDSQLLELIIPYCNYIHLICVCCCTLLILNVCINSILILYVYIFTLVCVCVIQLILLTI